MKNFHNMHENQEGIADMVIKLVVDHIRVEGSILNINGPLATQQNFLPYLFCFLLLIFLIYISDLVTILHYDFHL